MQRGTGGNNNGDDDDLIIPIDDDPGFDDIRDAPPTANCGDGVLDEDEACDDGNQESGDGCAGNCRYIEPGYICPDPGEPCRRFARCGDGIVVFPEQCDDGNLDPDDGCSPTCKVEIGWKCEGNPSECTRTVCGDGIVEGAETCDDGNTIPFDGCSPTCQGEPSCTDEGCTSICGDGIVLPPEECDDGNTIDGDGCSSDCKKEEGYECTTDESCETVNDECVMRLPIIYRDFNLSHSDFHPPWTQGDTDGHAPGIVQERLNAQGKPVFGAAPPHAHIGSAASFGEWYTDASTNAQIVSDIVLFQNTEGGYVNRFGENGEQYPALGQGRWCGNPDQYASCEAASAANQCNQPPFNPEVDACFTIGAELGPGQPNGCCTNCFCAAPQTMTDGNPLFFPIDGHPDALMDTRYPAKIPAQVYGAIGWPWEAGGTGETAPAGSPMHNFHFTSEIAYWFQYQEGMTANLTFIGDDDVWVFINRRRVIDLGGIHAPLAGTFNLLANGNVQTRTWEPPDQVDGEEEDLDVDSTTAAALGLEAGKVYEIKVFHAERKPDGSSFQLTLSGFSATRSECNPVCGDGILAAGEECDDGEENNVGGYNRCNPDCTLGGYCGDGIVQENEQCDDNAPGAPTTCRGCRIIRVR